MVDLLSRINGSVFEIPPFYNPLKSVNRRADKACVAVQLLRLRFGESLQTVPLAFLKFIVNSDFRYGVRSIAHLIEQIPYKKNLEHLRLADLKLPIKNSGSLKSNSLAYHLLNEDQAHGIINLWKDASTIKIDLPIFYPAIDRALFPEWAGINQSHSR